MMFYEIEINGETVGCELTLAAAMKVARDHDPNWCIVAMEIPVTAETIQLLLGNKGGFAKSVRHIEPRTVEAV